MLRLLALAMLTLTVDGATTPAPKSSPGTYMITFSTKIAPGWQVPINIQVLKDVPNVLVQVALVNFTDNTVLHSIGETVAYNPPRPTSGATNGNGKTVLFPIPNSLKNPWKWQELRFNFTGSGGLTFTASKPLSYQRKSKATLIQTDKATYKPGQTVKFRVVSVKPNLQVVKDSMDIFIYDANKNRIKQWLSVSDPKGVIRGQLETSPEPVLGDWTIEVKIDGYTEKKTFTIEEYVLPKFEVGVKLPSFLTTDMTVIPGTVTAMFTYGKGVDGWANVRVRMSYYISSWQSKLNPVIEKRVQVKNGVGDFVITTDEIRNLASAGDRYYESRGVYVQKPAAEVELGWRSIKVEANVTEEQSQNTLSAPMTTKRFNKNPNKMKFMQLCPNVFKAGLTYLCVLQVTQQDDTLVDAADLKPINITITYRVRQATTPAPPTSPTTTTMKPTPDMVLEKTNTTAPSKRVPDIIMGDVIGPYPRPYYQKYDTFTLMSEFRNVDPKTGLLEIKANIPANAESINLQASGLDTQAYKYASKSHSPSSNFIQLSVANAETKVGNNLEVQIRSTENIQIFTYKVMSRGSLVVSQTISAPTAGKSNKFNVRITGVMAPNPQVVVYYIRPDGEVVADAMTLKVADNFDNKIQLAYNSNKVKPGEPVRLRVSADPNTTVFLLAVDKSVLLKKSGNDITAEKVAMEMMRFGNYNPWFGTWYRFTCFWPFPSSGTDANSVFNGANLAVVTDANVYQHKRNYWDWQYYYRNTDDMMMMPGAPPPENGGADMPESEMSEPLQDIEKTRSFFPETWIWDVLNVGAGGVEFTDLTTPDTITTWITSGFGVNPSSGLSVATERANVTTFRKLFLNLNLPYSVVRGEPFCIQAIINNYHTRALPTLTTLMKNTDYQNVFLKRTFLRYNPYEQLYSTKHTQFAWAPAEGSTSVFFCIKPLKVGRINLNLTLQSWEKGDGLLRTLLVEPEGIERTENQAVLVDQRNPGTQTFQRDLPITFPTDIVAGSEIFKINVAGDILGPTLTNIDKLVRMPYGCGEQNMINFAPNIYVMKYLKKTGRLTTALKTKIETYMEKGYQRELKYKHREGCYSTFGDSGKSNTQRNCSMWLTGFVLKCFTQAYPLIPNVIDEKVVGQGLSWVIGQQRTDGSFPETGKVFNKRLQGGTGTSDSDVALTAFITLALKEAELSKMDYTGDTPSATSPIGGVISTGSHPVSSNLSQQKVVAAIMKAGRFLEGKLASLTSKYDKVLVAYALALINSAKATDAKNAIDKIATIEAGVKYWADPRPPKPPGFVYYSWNRGTDAKNIEQTAYALCTYSALNQAAEASVPIMRWLSNQRNDRGGFISTQDTIIALQCLSKFAEDVYYANTQMTITASMPNFQKQFTINNQTSLLLQSADVPLTSLPQTLRITAQGRGLAVVELFKQYNKNAASTNPTFDLKVQVLGKTDHMFVLNACFRHLQPGNSGMAILDVDVPTAYSPDTEKLKQTAVEFSRLERNGKKLTIYFDEIVGKNTCMDIDMNMIPGEVIIRAQPSMVTLSDYYEPDNSVTGIFRLTENDMCRVCKKCSYICDVLDEQNRYIRA